MGTGQYFSNLASGGHHGGADTKAEQKFEKALANARKEGGQERGKLSKQDRGLDKGADADPRSITAHENWQNYSHRQIYQTNQTSLKEAQVAGLADDWRKVASELAKVGPQLQHDSSRALQGAWEGQAAEAANKAGEPMLDWIQTSSQAFHLTGNKLQEAGSAAGQVKASVPPPQGFSPGQTAAASVPQGTAGGGGDAVQQMQQRQQDERAAQETMARVYTPIYHSVDGSVPAYTNLDKTPAPAHHPVSHPQSSRPSSAGGASGSGLDSPSSTQSAWDSSAPALGSAMAGATSLGGGAAGGAGGGLSGAGMDAADAGNLAAGGRAGAGALGGASTAAVRGAGMAGQAGGFAGAPGGVGGRGAGGQGGDEHGRPGWLEENDDIWLNDMPKTAPPVFGE